MGLATFGSAELDNAVGEDIILPPYKLLRLKTVLLGRFSSYLYGFWSTQNSPSTFGVHSAVGEGLAPPVILV